MHFFSDASIAVLRTLRARVRLTVKFKIAVSANFCIESRVLLNKLTLIDLPILLTHNSSSHKITKQIN